MIRLSAVLAVLLLAVCSIAQSVPVNSVLDMPEFVHDWQIWCTCVPRALSRRTTGSESLRLSVLPS